MPPAGPVTQHASPGTMTTPGQEAAKCLGAFFGWPYLLSLARFLLQHDGSCMVTNLGSVSISLRFAAGRALLRVLRALRRANCVVSALRVTIPEPELSSSRGMPPVGMYAFGSESGEVHSFPVAYAEA